MSQTEQATTRYIGLDLHKHYLVAVGLDENLNQVLGPQRVPLSRLDRWIGKTLLPTDQIALEVTTNAFQVYDELQPHVHSVIVVHPPHVALITRAQIMTDRIAARNLATLLAKGLLVSIWVPSPSQREVRGLVAQRNKMVRLSTQAKNRLHSLLHRHHIDPPDGSPFQPSHRTWWLSLPVSKLERLRIQCDLNVLAFAQEQIQILDQAITLAAATDDRVPILVQLPGIAHLTAVTLLAAIGDISRFPSAKHLVGYAGLGVRVHDSGQIRRTGRITKAGRRDIRTAMVETAHTAARTHPHWTAELDRLEPRLGYNKAIVAIARKLLVAVWHVLTKECADRFARVDAVARKLLSLANKLGKAHRPSDQTAADYVRCQLDRLGLGSDLTQVTGVTGKTLIALPESSLPPAPD
jgi:transposase